MHWTLKKHEEGRRKGRVITLGFFYPKCIKHLNIYIKNNNKQIGKITKLPSREGQVSVKGT